MRQRSGFALGTALLALGLIGALVTGTFFVATHEQRTGTDVLATTRALGAAELGVDAAMTTWDREWNVVMQRGDRRTAAAPIVDAASAITEIVRLDNQLFLVSSEGRSGPARRTVRRYVALTVPLPALSAAATLGGAATIDGTTQIDGTDRAPDGWICPDPAPSVAGVTTPDSSLIATNGCSLGTCVNGSPPIVVDSTLRHSGTLLHVGDLDWSELILRANATVEGNATPRSSERAGVCDVEDPHNWGDPDRSGNGVCANHFALIHSPGDLTIDGGRGQGILLVGGDLTIRGGFHFAGLVMVRGALHADAARISGALTVAAADSSTLSALNNLAVHFSRCAVHAAILGTAVPEPIVERSWFEVVDGQ
ncbi:MAG: hypothetical protein M3125_01750 [Gemmatimonadota bacterium]|nr:hypothetical protein [Gemmatimonadota bacterium]